VRGSATSNRPKLTFFVELEIDPLEALFGRPEVLPFLSAQGCAVSMGLLDLSPRRAAVVRRLETSGVPVTAWLLLDVRDGYWLNADNADRARERWRETAVWAQREGLRLPRVGLDVEFPRSESEGAIRDRRRAFFSMLRYRRTRGQVREAECRYEALVREIRESGRTVEAYHFPHLLDERAAGTTLLRRSLGLVDVSVDAEVYMLYSSYLGRAGARAYFADAPCIALGVTGGGVNAANPDARSRFLSWEQLAEDLHAAAACTREVYVFSLEGCVERGMLESIAEIRWDLPPSVLPRNEAARARRGRRITRWVLRAEPLFDLLLPSRRQYVCIRWRRALQSSPHHAREPETEVLTRDCACVEA
jgi:hypothetical protein